MPASAAPFFLRPRVALQEFDLTEQLLADQSTIAAVTGTFNRGPLVPTYTAGRVERFRELYGNVADPTLSFAHDTCQNFLTGSSNLLVNRIVNDAKYAGSHVFMDNDVVRGARLLRLPITVGGVTDASVAGPQPFLIKLDGVIGVGDTFTANVTDGATATAVSQAFSTNHSTTMTNFAVLMEAALNGFSTIADGRVSVFVETYEIAATSYTLVVEPPSDADLSVNTLVIAGGASSPNATVLDSSTNWLFTTIAENPGEWANDYGIKVAEINAGLRERYKLTFAAALNAGNVFTMSINSVSVAPVTFATDSDTTMAAIATAIAAHASVRSATVTTIAGTTDNDREIIIEAEVPGEDQITLELADISGGVAVSVGITHVLKGQASDGSIFLEVYDRSNPFFPVERHQFSTFSVVDGNGVQLKYTSNINADSGGSDSIRLRVNPLLETEAGFSTALSTMLDASFDLQTDSVIYMGGGANDTFVTTAQLVTGLEVLNNRSKYPLSLMLNAGITDISFQQALTVLCEDRKDCTAILDLPTEQQSSGQVARDYRLYDMNIDSSYAALYTPDLFILDKGTSERRFVPPSGHVGSAYVFNDASANKWSAPAGLTRGKIRQVLKLRYEYAPADEDLMHPNGINAIIDKVGYGPTIWGEETLQYKRSALSSVHIRRLMNLIEVTIADGVELFFWEGNTEFTRFRAKQLADGVLSPIHRRDGLYDYRTVCNEDNNTDEVIDNDAMALDVYVKPVRAIKGIILRAIITKTGVSFSEVITSFNQGGLTTG